MSVIGDGGHAKVIRSFYYHADTIIAIGDNAKRRQVALENEGMRPAVVYGRAIHPSAQVPASVSVGIGTVIMANVVVQIGATIGKHVILNTSCVVDHDCVIGDYAHIAPGAHLCGHVEIGEGTLVGVGVGIAPMCKIPAWTLVKARRLEMEPLYKSLEQDYGLIAGKG